MAGQGHQFPGNFQANAAGMRSGFGAGPMGNQMQAMPNQLAGTYFIRAENKQNYYEKSSVYKTFLLRRDFTHVHVSSMTPW